MSLDNETPDEVSEQLKQNPETALDLIQSFLASQGLDLDRGRVTSANISEVPGDEGDQLFYVSLTSIRNDSHVIRANGPEEALKKAVKNTEGDNTKAFTRRYETLDPVVFAIPRINDDDDLSGYNIGEVGLKSKIETSSEALKFKDANGTPTIGPSPRRTKLIEEMENYLTKQAEELD